MKARIYVTLKNGVLDPQGQAVKHSLGTLGFEGIGRVRQGKIIDIELDDDAQADPKQQLDKMCRQLLANTVIEDYSVEILS